MMFQSHPLRVHDTVGASVDNNNENTDSNSCPSSSPFLPSCGHVTLRRGPAPTVTPVNSASILYPLE